MKKTRIFFLTTTGKIGGTENIIYELMEHQGIKYDIMVCFLDSGKPLSEKLSSINIKTVSLNMNAYVDILKIVQMRKILKDFNPDIIMSFLYHGNLLARIIKIFNKKIIVINNERSGGFLKNNLRNFLDRITSKYCDLIITNSHSGRKHMKERGIRSRIEVIHNGIRIPKLRVKRNKHKLILACIGRLYKIKGCEYLISAMNSIRRKDVELWMIGDGVLRQELEKMSESNIKFLGYVENADRILPKIDIMVSASLFEGLPVSIIEAMMASKPVVATKVGGVPELVIHNNTGILVPPKNPNALARAIVRLITNKKLREKMGKEGRKRAEKYFTTERMVSQFEKAYCLVEKKK